LISVATVVQPICVNLQLITLCLSVIVIVIIIIIISIKVLDIDFNGLLTAVALFLSYLL